MKSKRHKTHTPRQTAAKKIATLPLGLAQQVARHGRTLHPVEQAAVEYLDALNWCKLADKSNDKTAVKAFGNGAAKRWEWLAFELMAAVQDRNGNTLRKLASFIEAYQYNDPAEDKTRRALLSMKEYHKASGRKITAKEIGERWLNFPQGTDLSRLRAIAKQVGYPLAPDSVGRPRKTQTGKQILKA